MTDTTKTPTTGELSQFEPYPAYRNSGIKWLGKIPAHWEVTRLKRIAAIQYGLGEPPQQAPRGLPFITATHIRRGRIVDEGLPFVDPADVPWHRDPALRAGDIIVVRSGAGTGDSAIVPESYDGAIAGNPIVVRPRSCHPGFLGWTLLSRYVLKIQIEPQSRRTAQPHLNAEELGHVSILTPPLAEQTAIAVFLDRETARIDALITKRARQMELLREEHSAVVQAAVTGDSTSPQSKLAYYVDLLPGYAFPSHELTHDPDDIKLLRGVNISSEGIVWDDTVHWPVAEAAPFERYRLQEGDLVLGMDTPWIGSGTRVAEVTASDVPSLLTQRVARLRARPGLTPKYLKVILSSPRFRAHLEPIIADVPYVSPEKIRSYRVGLPSLEAQETRCRHAQAMLLKIRSMRNVLEKSIALTNELRTTLITAAVTGKIDVRKELA